VVRELVKELADAATAALLEQRGVTHDMLKGGDPMEVLIRYCGS